jgi:hypothetical protein
MEYNEHRKLLGHDQTGGGKDIAQNGQGPRLGKMWQGSQNLFATQKESGAPNRQMTAVGYIYDMEEIVKAFWALPQFDGAATITMSERSPVPPALSAKDPPGG